MNEHLSEFFVRSYEAGVDNRVGIAQLCNYLQEAAGAHAEELGFGILELQSKGISWMLSRLSLEISSYPRWGEKLKVRTWPSGLKGRLVATRDFEVETSGGATVLNGVSEWLVVNLAARRIEKLDDSFRSLVVEDCERANVASQSLGGKFAALGKTDASARIIVRRGDLDFNNHVNNVHYAEWLMEALPEEFGRRAVKNLDIVFKQEASAGETLEVRTEIADADTLRHVIVASENERILVTAQTVWQ
jgi:acyl-ACP thioesterase